MSQSLQPASKKQGFTLLEVLVAVLLAGLVVTVFFQLISASLRLESNAARIAQETVDLQQAWTSIIVQDVREHDFKWQGELEGGSWSLSLEPVQTRAARDTAQEVDSGFRLDSELYKYTFSFKTTQGKVSSLQRLVLHEPGFFAPEFKTRHLD